MHYNYDIIDSVCHHCDTNELLALNLVSNRVNELAAPHLYKGITITNRKQLVLLQHALVGQPRLRRLVRRVTLLKRVIMLSVRGSIQPTGDAGRGYVYGDVDLVQCLTALLIPLPNLSHLDVDVGLPNLLHADVNIVRVFTEVLGRSTSNTVVIGKSSSRIPPPSDDIEAHPFFQQFVRAGLSEEDAELLTRRLDPTTDEDRHTSIRGQYSIDSECNQRLDARFPLPLDGMELHPSYDPPFPVLHWLGFGSYLIRSIEALYRITHEMKHSPPFKTIFWVGIISSLVACGCGFALVKLLHLPFP